MNKLKSDKQILHNSFCRSKMNKRGSEVAVVIFVVMTLVLSIAALSVFAVKRAELGKEKDYSSLVEDVYARQELLTFYVQTAVQQAEKEYNDAPGIAKNPLVIYENYFYDILKDQDEPELTALYNSYVSGKLKALTLNGKIVSISLPFEITNLYKNKKGEVLVNITHKFVVNYNAELKS